MAQIAVGPQVSKVWSGNGPVLLANQDVFNSVTVGDRQNITIGSMSGDVIPPLGSISYVTGKPLYAIAPSGTAALLAISGGTSWSPSPSPVLQAATEVLQPTGTTTFFTFPQKGRIWAASLSVSIVANSSYTAVVNSTYGAIETGSGLTLEIVELSVAAANQVDSVHGDLNFGGLPVNKGETLILDINNGVSVTNLQQRGSCVVLYSIP